MSTSAYMTDTRDSGDLRKVVDPSAGRLIELSYVCVTTEDGKRLSGQVLPALGMWM